MKKLLKNSVAIALILGLGMVSVGCSSKDNSATNQNSANNTQQNVTNNNQSENNNEQQDTNWFMGEWIAKEIVAYSPVGSDNNECEEHLGEKVSFSKDKVVNYEGPQKYVEKDTLNNPIYQVTKVTDKQFQDKWKTSLHSIKIDSTEAEVMTVKEKDNETWDEFGDYIIKKDDNHLILADDGGFFLMEKVSANNK